MISRELYNEIYGKWVGEVGSKKIYQEWRRIAPRIKHLEQTYAPLKGKSVLEIGCNAGMHGYHVAQIAEEYVGIDPGAGYIQQALITEQYVETKNATFVNDNISGIVEIFCGGYAFNAFMACFALYHFEDFEIELLKKHVFPKCDVVFIQNRNQKRPTAHNSYKFWKYKNIMKFFEKEGFETEEGC